MATKMSQGGGVKGLYALKSDAARNTGGLVGSSFETRPLSAGNRPNEDESGVEQRLKIVKRHRGSKDAASDVPPATDPADRAYVRCAVGCKVSDSKVMAALVQDVVDKHFFPSVISL